MEFLVIYFAFDNAFEAVNMSKVECDKTEAEMVKGTKCQVPFETESISEDGKDTVETKLYDGIILCSGQGKKSVELFSKKNDSTHWHEHKKLKKNGIILLVLHLA